MKGDIAITSIGTNKIGLLIAFLLVIGGWETQDRFAFFIIFLCQLKQIYNQASLLTELCLILEFHCCRGTETQVKSVRILPIDCAFNIAEQIVICAAIGAFGNCLIDEVDAHYYFLIYELWKE